MKYFLWIMPFMGLALPTFAQESVDCEANDNGELNTLICEDSTLKADHQAMVSIWQTWTDGINADRIEYLTEEQTEWMSAREECLSEAEPNACLAQRYEDRIRILTSPRIFQREMDVDGIAYAQRAAMTPISYNALNLQKTIEDYSFSNQLINDYQEQVLVPADDECPLCTTEINKFYQLGFGSPELVMLNCEASEEHDDSEPVQSYEMQIYDATTDERISFSDLFDPSTVPFAKNAIIEQILSELERINRSVEGNENGDKQYFWAETEMNLNAMSDEEWNKMGFFPVVQDGKIMGFSYRADDFEFAPMGSTQYFSGFEIPSSNFSPYLKPQYSAYFN